MKAYWHGGKRGLAVGSLLLPPSVTGEVPVAAYAPLGQSLPANPERVYVTTDEAAALMYAVMHPSKGSVYRVRPLGELALDPDCSAPGLSWECASAVIESVRVPSSGDRRRVLKALGMWRDR